MLHGEYPHSVIFQVKSQVSDGMGGGSILWTDTLTINGFMDTPSSREIFEAQQLQNPLDRNLFYPYRTDVDETMRVLFEGEVYDIVGRPQDQGGQREVMKVPLKLVANG